MMAVLDATSGNSLNTFCNSEAMCRKHAVSFSSDTAMTSFVPASAFWRASKRKHKTTSLFCSQKCRIALDTSLPTDCALLNCQVTGLSITNASGICLIAIFDIEYLCWLIRSEDRTSKRSPPIQICMEVSQEVKKANDRVRFCVPVPPPRTNCSMLCQGLFF